MRRWLAAGPVARACACACTCMGAAACTLMTSLDGFSGGGSAETADSGPRGVDGATADDAPFDAAPPDGPDAQVAACPVPANDPTLVAWYPFDEGAGTTVFDCSGNGQHGTPLPSTSFTRVAARPGESGRA